MEQDETGAGGRIRQKLVETKQAWAKAGRLLTGETARPEEQRLPPASAW
ncbi:hypothetical protein [Teichococcus aestuarii]